MPLLDVMIRQSSYAEFLEPLPAPSRSRAVLPARSRTMAIATAALLFVALLSIWVSIIAAGISSTLSVPHRAPALEPTTGQAA